MKKLLFLLSVALFTSTALHAAFTPAAFTVSAEGKQVLFSQGNLQCSGVTSDTYTWSFAENQYDMIGNANVSDGALADKIDLFGWSGSTGAKWGISTSTSNADYSGDFVDWGTNTIGTDEPNTYRTLTYDEWDYLLNTRTDAANKRGVARIQISDTEYANGLILLPDSWTLPDGVTFQSGFSGTYSEEAYAVKNLYTTEQWKKLEAAGAVFLPASGDRYGSDVDNVQYGGGYWSATPRGTGGAYDLGFGSYAAGTYNNYRYYGQAVRLVQDIKYTLTLTQPEHGTIAADKTEAVAGETVTLTITPAAYSTLKSFSVLQGETPITTTAVEDTTNQYTFTMPAGKVTVSAVFEKVASAFTPAAFTVSESGTQILFSQGNLQCSGLTTNDTTWSFAEYQTEMIGADNMSSEELADTIDLFGWSGSTGSAKWGISTSTDNADYSGEFVDWGTNTIGTDKPDTWRTLTNDEWKYLRYNRTNADQLIGVARIKLNDAEYANGLILLPDSWDCPEDITFKSDFASAYSEQAYADYQTFTLADWQKLEAAGAVFLPASGGRYGSGVGDVQYYGSYWSATPDDAGNAGYLDFYSGEAGTGYYFRCYGQAVRLVQDIKYTLTLTQPEHGTLVADKTKAVAGETVTLTLSTDDAYYALKTITVLQGETPITTTAVEDTTNQYTFTMPAGEVTVSAEFEKVASAFTPAAFTVSESGKQVLFSQGNLQCSGLTTNDTTWSFAEYQTDMIGTDNMSGGTEQYDDNYGYSKSGDALADKIDLFGWSGSTGSAKWGIGTSRSNTDYAGDFEDWGQTIGDGTTYRTLTYDEWDYLLNTRANADEKRGVARIKLSETEYANGLILLPDSLTCPADVKFTSGFARSYSIEAYATHQTFTLAQWQQLEAAGAVFLPASGYRDGSYVYGVQSYGRYWSATPDEPNSAYDLSFYLDGAGAGDDSRRSCGRAVRLVQDVYAVNIAATTNGTVAADKTEAVAGDEVTLTITPDTGYELDVLTVQDAAGNPVTVNDNTFTMPASNVTVSATFKQSPQTAIGNTTDAADTTVRKVLIDGQVYILRGNTTYTTTGIEVRP